MFLLQSELLKFFNITIIMVKGVGWHTVSGDTYMRHGTEHHWFR